MPLLALRNVRKRFGDHVGLLGHLDGVERRRDLIDGSRQVGRLVAGDGPREGDADQHQPDRDDPAGAEQLRVDPSVPR